MIVDQSVERGGIPRGGYRNRRQPWRGPPSSDGLVEIHVQGRRGLRARLAPVIAKEDARRSTALLIKTLNQSSGGNVGVDVWPKQ